MLRIDFAKITLGRLVRGLSAPVLAVAVVASFAAPAQAARVHPLLLREVLPSNLSPFGIAVNQATGHFYVTAFSSDDRHVFNYEDNGQLDPVTPELTGAPALFQVGNYLAVDNSGGASDGDVYVTGDIVERNSYGVVEAEVGRVQQFGPDGEATSVAITEASVPANGTAQGGGLPPVVNKGSFKANALAVGGSGNVYVLEAYFDEATQTPGGAIDVFTSEGVFVEQLAAGSVDGGTWGIALDSAGDIYLANVQAPSSSPLGNEGRGLFELGPSGECLTAGCAPIDPAEIHGVAVDEAGGKVFTTATTESGSGQEGRFSEYEVSTGALLGSTRPSGLYEPYGIAVNEATGEVIVADTADLKEGMFQIYGPVEVVPDVKTLAPEEVTSGSAVLRGEIGAAGVAGATCAFQYVSDEGFKARGFEGAAEAACESGPFSGTAMHEVSARVKGLEGGTAYHYRIVGVNENGSNAGEAEGFNTLGPTVSGAEVVEVSQSAATLEGVVDPNGSPASYRFQYVTQAQYEEDGWVGAVEAPPGGRSIGEVSGQVSERVEGLTPGTSYRFRVLAASATGETSGEGAAFATYGLLPVFGACPNEAFREGRPAGALPDCRAYEQASPVDKNGANAQGGIDSVQAALDGDGITFFANTGLPGGEGSQQFPTYMSTRAGDGSGWSTQGLLPSASYGPLASVLGWTESLQETYDYAGGASAEGALLRRADTSGSVAEVRAFTAQNNPLAYAGSSQDGAVALLESNSGRLLPGIDRAGEQNVYVYDRETGELALAGVLNPTTPAGAPETPAEGAMAGPYQWNGDSLTAPGGTLGKLFTQALHAISTDGSRVVFTAGGTGQLYVRESPLASQSAMSGEACTEAGKACTIRVSAPEAGVSDPGTPAAFVGASADGRLVYFLDQGRLTKDATGGSGYDLYRYDVATGKLTDLTLDTVDKKGARVEGVLGIGESGEDVYFVAAGELSTEATQAPAGETNLYQLQDGQIHFIARLGTSEGETLNWEPTEAGGTPPSASKGSVAHASRVSADGQTLLLRSSRRLTGYDNHGFFELYLYRSGRGLWCVSCDPTGQAPVGPAGVQEIPLVGFELQRNYAFMTRNLSANGRRVFFDSPDRLVAGDENDVNDVYEWEAKGEGSCESEAQDGGCLFLISSGAKDVGPSWFGDADEEGNNVFFFTAQQLVAQDKDELVDVYDARVDGGIASQEEEEPAAACGAEVACLGSAPASPSLLSPATLSFTGPGDLVSKPGSGGGKPKVKPRRLTRAQKLAKALKACGKKKPKKRRAKCRAQARKRYAAPKKPKHTTKKRGR